MTEQTPVRNRSAGTEDRIGRWALGLTFFAAIMMLIAGTAQFFGSLGLPGPLAYLVILAEVVGGLALIAGIYSRIVALALTPVLLGAIFTVHGPAGFFFTNPTGGWEFPALWIVGLLAVALIGDGAYALRPTPGAARPAVRCNAGTRS